MQTRPAGTRLRIVNAGHMGYAFDQQLVLMKELIARYRPRVVVQGFYWMHIRSLFNHRHHRATDGTLLSVEDPTVRIDDRGILEVRSDWDERPLAGLQVAMLPGLLERIPDWIDFMRPKLQPEALWAITEQVVGETVGALRAAGVAYVPFLVSTAVEVGGSNWASVGWNDEAPPLGVDQCGRVVGQFFIIHGTDIGQCLDTPRPPSSWRRMCGRRSWGGRQVLDRHWPTRVTSIDHPAMMQYRTSANAKVQA